MREDAISMGLSQEDLISLLEAFEEFGWSEMILTVNGTRVELTGSGQPPAGAAGAVSPDTARPPNATRPPDAARPPDASASSTAPQRALHDVPSPSVGIFYVAPEPGAPPFVEVGQHVNAEDIVCIVEVMKLINHVKAGLSGIVRTVHAQNGTMVQHGQPLLSIEPDA
jgi:acetyl-CoA carboxylase biotin carboxyl carrier protein